MMRQRGLWRERVASTLPPRGLRDGQQRGGIVVEGHLGCRTSRAITPSLPGPGRSRVVRPMGSGQRPPNTKATREQHRVKKCGLYVDVTPPNAYHWLVHGIVS